MCQAVYLVDDNAVIAVDCGFQREARDDLQAIAAFNAHEDMHSAERFHVWRTRAGTR